MFWPLFIGHLVQVYTIIMYVLTKLPARWKRDCTLAKRCVVRAQEVDERVRAAALDERQKIVQLIIGLHLVLQPEVGGAGIWPVNVEAEDHFGDWFAAMLIRRDCAHWPLVRLPAGDHHDNSAAQESQGHSHVG